MSATPKEDRPREKLQVKGPAALSDFELLQALIGSGNARVDVATIAKATLKLIQKYGADVTYEQLQTVVGLGSAKITEVLAAIELSKRYLIGSDQPIIDSPEKAVEQLADIRDKKQEYFVCMTFDGANRLIAKRIITIGTLTASLVHPREVFKPLILMNAGAWICAHNHPSGDLTPSPEDRVLTKRLREAADLFGIPLLDHLILAEERYYSFADQGWPGA